MKAILLVVDDDEIIRNVTNSQLKRLGYECTVVKNGKEAVAKFAEQEFDLILLDVQMPHMDGLEASRSMRELESRQSNRKRATIIAMTANPDKKQCSDAGMDDFLFKPVMLGDLRSLLNKWNPECPV